MFDESSRERPFESILSLHKSLNEALLSRTLVSSEKIRDFLMRTRERASLVKSAEEQDKLRYLMRFWGSYLAAQGAEIPDLEIDTPEHEQPDTPDYISLSAQTLQQTLSIHIGVSRSREVQLNHPLRNSELIAAQMANLAIQAGYGSILLLRDAMATRHAVGEALTKAALSLNAGDILFVSFAGCGWQALSFDYDSDERWAVGWCLTDGVLMEEELVSYWRLFAAGVRIVLVTESCYSGGMDRDNEDFWSEFPTEHRSRFSLGVVEGSGSDAYIVSCVREPSDSQGIKASVLWLSAAPGDQVAREGLFSQALFGVWADGTFEGSFCELYREVRARVMADADQEPQITMMGAVDPDFPLEIAFHIPPPKVYR